MKLKKPSPGNHQCDAMRCKARPKFLHQTPDGTVIELCTKHHIKAKEEYGDFVSQMTIHTLGPKCDHEDCYKHYKDCGFVDCLYARPASTKKEEPLPEPEILEPAALAKVEAVSSELSLLAKEEFVAQLQQDAKEAKESLEAVKNFEITSQEDFTFLEKVLVEAKGDWKRYEERRTSFTKPANAVLREFNSWFRPVQEALQSFERVAKSKLSAYRLIKLQEQQLFLDEARAAEEPKAIQTALVNASEAVPEQSTSQVVDKWVYEIVDVSQIPLEFMVPDTVKIGAYARTHKDKAHIPGVRIWNETTMRSKAK